LSIKEDSNIRSDLANVYFELKDYKEAQKQANEILEIESNHSNARLLLCKLLVANKEYAKALGSLEELLAIDKNNVPAYYLKAVCLIEEDLQDLPAQEIQMVAAGNFSTEIWKRNMAIESLKTAVELSPGYFMARLLLADLYMKNNDLVQAEKQVAYILEHTPKDLKALYMSGNLKIMGKEWEAAEKIFHQIVDMAPGFPPAYIKLGLIYASNQKTSQAIEAFQNALNLDPLDMNALRYIVNTYMANNQRGLSKNC
jgi:tetratricopeptide (TPR) repeat protein